MQLTNMDNLIIGTPLPGISLDDLGIGREETTVCIGLSEAAEMEFFLPRLLVHAGLFKSTSEIRRINKDRKNSKKITDPLSRDLWRKLSKPEFTHIKVGKRVFWLLVGETSA